MSDPTAPHQPDENERLQQGKLPADAKEGTAPVPGKGKAAPRVLTVKQILQSSVDRAKAAKNRTFCSTGNYWIDEATGGMMPGDCWLLGADTSAGKSSLAIMMVDVNVRVGHDDAGAPRPGKRILIVSSEDEESLYGDRLMCRRAGIDAKRYRNGTINQAEWSLITATLARGEPVPVFFDGRFDPIEVIAPQLDKIIKEQAIDLVIFDYLQEFRSRRKFQDERVKYKEIAAVMRRVIKANKRCGLILSQLTMTPGKRLPDKHNIRESRDVANASETILILFIPEQDITDVDTDEVLFKAGQRVVLIDKCKKGPRGARIFMPWDDKTASFQEVVEPEDERLARLAETVNMDDDEDLGSFAEDGGAWEQGPPEGMP